MDALARLDSQIWFFKTLCYFQLYDNFHHNVSSDNVCQSKYDWIIHDLIFIPNFKLCIFDWKTVFHVRLLTFVIFLVPTIFSWLFKYFQGASFWYSLWIAESIVPFRVTVTLPHVKTKMQGTLIKSFSWTGHDCYWKQDCQSQKERSIIA